MDAEMKDKDIYTEVDEILSFSTPSPLSESPETKMIFSSFSSLKLSLSLPDVGLEEDLKLSAHLLPPKEGDDVSSDEIEVDKDLDLGKLIESVDSSINIETDFALLEPDVKTENNGDDEEGINEVDSQKMCQILSESPNFVGNETLSKSNSITISSSSSTELRNTSRESSNSPEDDITNSKQARADAEPSLGVSLDSADPNNSEDKKRRRRRAAQPLDTEDEIPLYYVQAAKTVESSNAREYRATTPAQVPQGQSRASMYLRRSSSYFDLHRINTEVKQSSSRAILPTRSMENLRLRQVSVPNVTDTGKEFDKARDYGNISGSKYYNNSFPRSATSMGNRKTIVPNPREQERLLQLLDINHRKMASGPEKTLKSDKYRRNAYGGMVGVTPDESAQTSDEDVISPEDSISVVGSQNPAKHIHKAHASYPYTMNPPQILGKSYLPMVYYQSAAVPPLPPSQSAVDLGYHPYYRESIYYGDIQQMENIETLGRHRLEPLSHNVQRIGGMHATPAQHAVTAAGPLLNLTSADLAPSTDRSLGLTEKQQFKKPSLVDSRLGGLAGKTGTWANWSARGAMGGGQS